MEFSEATLAAGKLAAVFLVLVILLRLHVRLWLSILIGALVTVILTGTGPAAWPGLIYNALSRVDFVLLCVMVYLIMLLSAVQDATGQSRKLVEGLKLYLNRPRLRLVLFPALVGLLPMPGGALFSCPMIEAAASDMGISGEKKGLINYWFRHIWETAWPLYPGYALVCTLLGISMTELWKYTFPLVFLAFAFGWYFYMRDLSNAPSMQANSPCSEPEKATEHICHGHSHEAVSSAWAYADAGEPDSLGQVLMHALPIAVTLVGAAVFGYTLGVFFPAIPGQTAFFLSLLCAVATALFQGKGHMTKPLSQLAFSKNTGRIMLLLVSIYIFKESISEGGIVQEISHLGDSPLFIVLTFIVVPFVSGMLTGIMVAFVGISFPILLALIEQSPLKEYTLPLMVLAMISGNCGQMLSPLHVCLVVTCEFFNTRLPGFWRALVKPTVGIFLGGVLWVVLLAALGLHF